MSAAIRSHEIDAERETPALVLMRTQQEPWRTKPRHDDVLGAQLTGRPSSVEPSDQAMTAMDVRAAIAQLTPEHRQVIVEMFYLGRSVTEIAQLLNVPEGTVTSRSYDGLRQLTRLLPTASGEPPPKRQRPSREH